MAYNFLGLVNNVNEKFNEVPLTSVNFSAAAGFYSDAKTAVNAAINKINRHNFEWPFNHINKDLVLTPDVSRYAYEADAKTIAYYSFRIKGDDTLQNDTVSLFPMDYEEYLEKYSDMENRPTDYSGIPEVVFRTPSLEFGIAPAPDKAYTLKYEYYSVPTKLVAYDDVPSIPEFFEYVITDGAWARAFTFRGDSEMAEKYEGLFEQGIEDMRGMFTNRQEYLRSTMKVR